MEKNLRKDVIEWDEVTWGRAVDFWNAEGLRPPEDGGLVLDLGSRGGGLSLLFALLGWRVHCTDLENPEATAKPLHDRYGVGGRITYRALDALELDAVEAYDIICFKSVMGGVGHHDNYAAQRKMMENIHRALKPGGYLLFAENTTSSPLHRFLRKRFNAWDYWRYVSLDEVEELCRPFSEARRRSFGFLGALGRSEGQRVLLGSADRALDRFLPEGARYCVSVAARK